MNTTRYRTINCPQHADSKYIIIDGEVYLNLSADPGTVILGRFIRSTNRGTAGR